MSTAVLDGTIHPGGVGSLPSLDFVLPPSLEAELPPEERGLRRDQVRLMVSYRHSLEVIHSRFDRLPDLLEAGDVLVINTSATLKAALPATRSDGMSLELHLSTHLPDDHWVVEIRRPTEQGTASFFSARPGEKLSLPGGGVAQLHRPYPLGAHRNRLWSASLELPLPFEAYLERYGFPIRYKYIRKAWPIEYYQNVYATEPGSAEMPSAGRAFTPELITRLVARGILFAPFLLHTGVASLEGDEGPYEEYYCLPAGTARLVNMAHSAGGRVIAVGTTSIRALQSATDEDGCVHASEGWTDLVITPTTTLPAIDGLLTGLHEPRSTHLSMLLALAGYEHVARAYREALQGGYLWHEFGDLHLILP
jgi:S-adenosylmethionine:tRNA ribosyltransferase-isomerase